MLAKLLELFGIAKTALAASTPPCNVNDPNCFNLPNPFGTHDFVWVVGKIAEFLIKIGGPLAAIMILIGGFYMVTAGGSSERFSTGKKTILYATIGLAVILMAQGVAAIIQSIFR